MSRIFNFSAGPAALPLPVLETAREEMLDYNGSGMSIMEMSHRSSTYQAVIDAAEANLRRLLGISDAYDVLFLQGGASQQFAMLAANFLGKGQTADYVHTGSWASKAIKEAQVAGNVHIAWDGKADNYMRVPDEAELSLTPGAAYVHITSNETIGGIQFQTFPTTEAPLLADMSSDILSRPLPVDRFGMIYAGAQKNIGPSGLALVILRKDLTARTQPGTQLFWQYKIHADNGSMYNTPNTWAIYIVKLVTDWVDSLGGLEALQQQNLRKAEALYAALDKTAFYTTCAQTASRSLMNVTWRLPNEELEAKFAKEASAAGLSGLKGHRSVGGLRASIYNACPPEAVEALVQFLADFEAKNG